MGKSQRTKGHAFERQIAKKLRQFFPDAKRGFQTRGGGKEAADIINTPFHVECKVGKSHSIEAAITQAEDDTDGKPPLAITKRDFKPVRVTMNWDLFEQLLEKAYAGKS